MIEKEIILQHFRKYLTQEGSSIKTQKNYCADIEDYVSWGLKNNIADIIRESTKETVYAYITAQKSSGKSISTLNRRLSSLRIFYAFLLKNQLIKHNPVSTINNLSLDDAIAPHTHILQAYELQLRKDGHVPDHIHEHKELVSDFLRWIKKRPPN